MSKELVIIDPKEYGLPEPKANELTSGLDITLAERKLLVGEFETLSKLEVTKENIPKFKELRLKIVKNRTQGINKWHKTAKDYFLQGGKFVDAIKNKEIAVNELMELKLSNSEKHFENLRKQEVEKIANERRLEFEKYEATYIPSDLGTLDVEAYEMFLAGAKAKYDKIVADRIEQKRIEDERIRISNLEAKRKLEVAPYKKYVDGDEDIKAMDDQAFAQWISQLKGLESKDLAEQEATRLENVRLQNEAIKNAAKAKAEKDKLIEDQRKEREAAAKIQAKKDAELKAANDAKLKLEKEARESAAAKAKAEKDKLIEDQRLAELELQKGDKERFDDLINEIESISKKYEGVFKSAANIRKYEACKDLLIKTVNYIK